MFDWVLTLADLPDRPELVRRALGQIGRVVADGEVDDLVAALAGAAEHADVMAAMLGEDRSSADHRAANRLHHRIAGIDDELSEALYALLGDPTFLAVFPGVDELLGAIAEAGITIAVVSDIHVDLRGHAASAGIDHLVDHWILSFEHGIQKPDPAIFQLALAALGSDPEVTLMVGDRASHDGIAAALGIDTLIVPFRRGQTAAERLAPVRTLLLG